jgi:hypothetical protein
MLPIGPQIRISYAIFHCYGLSCNTSLLCTMRTRILVGRRDGHKETKSDQPGANGSITNAQIPVEEEAP